MASTHKSLRSGTANKRPTTSIADGQIALNTNTTSPGLFFKDSTGATIIKVGPVHVGTTAPNASPAAGGSAGNSVGEIWLDTSLTPVGVKIWNGSAFVNATPIGSTTVQGLLELATNAETQTGTDPDRAVTPAGLQSKVSDSTSTTSSTTIASSTAVKSAYDLANAALPKSGGTVTGNLEIGTTGSLSFEGATADAFETTIAVVDPTADRTITLPDTTGTVVTTGDTGTVTSTMIADGTIVNGDINASAAVDHSKLANITAGSVLLGNASNVPTATALSGDVTVNSTGVTAISSGVIVNADVNASAAIAGTKISPDFGSQTVQTTGIFSHALGTAGAPTVTFTGDTNTGIYSPGADQVAISTNGSGRLFINSSGLVGIGNSNPGRAVDVVSSDAWIRTARTGGNAWIVGTGVQDAYRIYDDTAGQERFRIDTSGRVGVGSSSPQGLIEARTDQVAATRIICNNGSSTTGASTNFDYYLGTTRLGGVVHGFGASAAYFGIDVWNGSAATRRLTIDASGSVGIGTSSPSTLFHCAGIARIGANDANDAELQIGAGATGNRPAYIDLVGDTTYTDYGLRVIRNATGANANSLIAHRGTGDLQLNALEAGAIGLFTNDTQRLRITSAGNVGIGTTSPSATLTTVANSSAESIRCLGRSSDNVGQIFVASNSGTDYGGLRGASDEVRLSTFGALPLTFYTNGGERGRFDTSGRLLVGTSSSTSTSPIVVQGYVGVPAGAGEISITRGGTPSAADQGLGTIRFQNNNANTGAAIECISEGSWTAGSNHRSRLVFSTTADGASSPTERMRITNAGALSYSPCSGSDLVGNEACGFIGDAAYAPIYKVKTALTSTKYAARFYNGNGEVGNITMNGSATAYNTSSDYRLKENVVAVVDGITRLQQLKPSRFNFKADPTNTVDGFIAHEVQAIVPEAVTGEKDGTDSDGNPKYQGIDQSKLVPLLTAALQEAIGRIETLEAEVAALKAA